MVRQELIILEQEVLGGPIIDNSLYYHLKENVKEGMFVVPEHKEIFKLVSGMFEKGLEVSVTDILVYATLLTVLLTISAIQVVPPI